MSSQTEAYFESPEADDNCVRWLAAKGVHTGPDQLTEFPRIWPALRAEYDASPEAVTDCDEWAADRAHHAAEWIARLNNDTPQEHPC